MKNTAFIKGQKYTGSEIEKNLGNGTYQQVVILSKSKGVLGIRFKANLNPNWNTKNEVWIHHGEKRIYQAEQWVNEQSVVPIFCSEDNSNKWTYLGNGSAVVLARDEAAFSYTKDKRVGLVLKMNITTVKENAVRTIRRAKNQVSAPNKRAA